MAPVLARWQNKQLAAALQAFAHNVATSQAKRQQLQKAVQWWSKTAVAAAFAQCIQSVEVSQAVIMTCSPCI